VNRQAAGSRIPEWANVLAGKAIRHLAADHWSPAGYPLMSDQIEDSAGSRSEPIQS
jgi:hypothetical protein